MADGSKSLEAGLPRYERPTSARDSDPTEVDYPPSLGVVMYEIKTGQMVYAGKSNGEIRKSLEGRHFPDLASLPLEWRVIVNKCWQEGYNNAEEVLADPDNLSRPIEGNSSQVHGLVHCYSTPFPQQR